MLQRYQHCLNGASAHCGLRVVRGMTELPALLNIPRQRWRRIIGTYISSTVCPPTRGKMKLPTEDRSNVALYVLERIVVIHVN